MHLEDLVLRLHLPYITLAGFIVLVNVYLFYLYHSADGGTRPAPRWWRPKQLEFSPSDLGGFSYWQLGLASIAGLFLELLLIRWISSEIHVFAYFKNFVLIACFLGFGLGCYLCRRNIHLLALCLPLLTLAIVIKAPWESWHIILRQLPSLIGDLCEVDVHGLPSIPRSFTEVAGLLKTIAIIVPLFSIIAFLFIPVGQLVGWYLEKAPRGIRGYTINILGSLLGILSYTALCFLNQAPVVWFCVAGALLMILFWRSVPLRWIILIAFLACAGLTLIPPGKGYRTYWSPYQKLSIRPILSEGETIAYEISTNDSWYQQIFNMSPGFLKAHPQLLQGVAPSWTPYNLPYKFFPNPGSVLVLGAGTGNDVAAALRNGAGRVVAVEIDPLIQRLGQELHFEHPYSSPLVVPVINDARSYLQNTNEQFDVIMFSLLDSHTTSSHFSNIRIDNYVYTREALEAAKRLLKPGGLLYLKFFVETPWISGRLDNLCETVFGRPPLRFQADAFGYSTAGRFFINGSQERLQAALQDPELASYVKSHHQVATAPASLTTDDWPFFYQHEPGLPSAVIIISLILLVLGWLFLRDTGISAAALNWHFFFLGAGFMLLEAQIISKMALLFGTTWVVNSIVISGLMVLIVGSNALIEWKPNLGFGLAYAGIFLSIVVSFVIPIERFFFSSFWMKALTATLVMCLPVFFAGMVFIRSFASAGFRGEALGSNLFGALTGGLLETLSFWTGIRSLLIVAALLYLASALFLKRRAALPLAQT
jgi:spermidine synthase